MSLIMSKEGYARKRERLLDRAYSCRMNAARCLKFKDNANFQKAGQISLADLQNYQNQMSELRYMYYNQIEIE